MADCVAREVEGSEIQFLLTEDVDDESLLISLDMIECFSSSDEFEEVENELDAVWNDVSFKANIFVLWIVTEARPSERKLGRLQSLLLRNCHRLESSRLELNRLMTCLLLTGIHSPLLWTEGKLD